MFALLCVGFLSLQGLQDLWRPPELEARQVSSGDPTGGNRDHGNFAGERKGRKVLLRVRGSGLVQRIWSANPKGRLRLLSLGDGRVLFDGLFAGLFSGKAAGRGKGALPSGLPAGGVGGGKLSHRPMAFRGGLLATLSPERDPDLDCYYQIGYGILHEGGDWKRPVSEVEARFAAAWARFGVEEPGTRAGGLPDGTLRRSVELCRLEGPGVLRGLRFRLPWSRLSSSVRCRIFFDGAELPAIDVPLREFMGCARGGAGFQTSVLGGVGGARWFHLPMPFLEECRIVLLQEDGEAPPLPFDFRWAWSPGSFPVPPRYLHAAYRIAETRRGRPVRILEAGGPGHFVGLCCWMDSGGRGLSFLEGDEEIRADGKIRFRGTGTEDYFDGAWYFRGGLFAHPFASLAVKEEEGRIAVCRFHVPDPVSFERSFRFELEHGGTNDTEGVRYASLAFWYAEDAQGREDDAPPPWPLRADPPRPPRLGFEAEDLEGARSFLLAPAGREAGLSGAAVLALPAGKKVRLLLPSLPAGRWLPEFRLAENGAPQKGSIDLLGTKTPLNLREGTGTRILTGSPVTTPGGEALLVLEAESGTLWLDRLRFLPYRDCLRRFLVCGPFPNPGRKGLDLLFPPEKNPGDFPSSREWKDSSFPVLGSGRTGWFEVEVSKVPDGYVDLRRVFEPGEDVVVYALAEISSETSRKGTLLLGTDDGFKVWWNGRLLRRRLVIRGSEPEQERLPVEVRKGRNVLLLKVENHLGGFGFHAALR